jgi:hypothetical protein
MYKAVSFASSLWLTNFMEQSPSCKVNTHSASLELPHLLWNPKVHYRFHKGSPLVLIVRQMHPVYTFPPVSLRSILILSSHLRLGLPSDLFPSHLFTLPRSFQRIRQILRPCVTFRNNLFYYGEKFLPHAQLQSWSTTPCPLSAITYSTYSQLPSISGGCLLHPQPKDAPCRGERDPRISFTVKVLTKHLDLRGIM